MDTNREKETKEGERVTMYEETKATIDKEVDA